MLTDRSMGNLKMNASVSACRNKRLLMQLNGFHHQLERPIVSLVHAGKSLSVEPEEPTDKNQ